MPIETPFIVQSSQLQQLGSTPDISLPNPVTIGNYLFLFVCGGIGVAGQYHPGFASGPPTGWSNISGSHAGAPYNGQAGVVWDAYSQLATSAIPPVVSLEYWGGIPLWGVMMEVANCGTQTFAAVSEVISGNNVTYPPFGSVQSAASLYFLFQCDYNSGAVYEGLLPNGVTEFSTFSAASSIAANPFSALILTDTSVNPATFGFTSSTTPTAGTSSLLVGILAGEANVGPPVPPENIVASAGTQDVVYAVVERTTVRDGIPYRYYTVEVMASRLLGGNFGQAVPSNIEYSWAVDAGVQVAPANPSADLWITPGNAGAIASLDIIIGGDDYPSNLVGNIIDAVGSGSGAEVTFTVTGGVVTGYTLTAAGSGYVQPVVQLQGNVGQGAVITAQVSNTCTLYADAAIWTSGDVGDITRAAGGKVQITAVTNTQNVSATILEPFTQFVPNTSQPGSCVQGQWSQGPNITRMPYLDHLEGMEVVGLADGSVFGPVPVVNGAVALPLAASIVTVGLGFVAQLQTLRLDLGSQNGSTVQTKRKKVSALNLRVQDTQGLMVGTDWAHMTPIKPAGYAPSNAPLPFSQGGGIQDVSINGLYGQDPVSYLDQRNLPPGGWDVNGQVCIQQSYPLPMSILAVIPEISIGDS